MLTALWIVCWQAFWFLPSLESHPLENASTRAFGFSHPWANASASSANQPPVISNIQPQMVEARGAYANVRFSVSDADTPAGRLVGTARTSNTNWVELLQVQGIDGPNPEIVFLLRSGKPDRAIITVAIFDPLSGVTVEEAFLLYDESLGVDAKAVVRIVSPPDRLIELAGRPIVLEADFGYTEAKPVAVRFLRNGFPLDMVTRPPFRTTLENFTAGRYVLTAEATFEDDQTKRHASQPITIELLTPTVALGELAVGEGDVGIASTNVVPVLGTPFSGEQTIEFFTSDGTAKQGVDYLPVIGGRLTLTAPATTAPIEVQILGDRIREDDEWFFLNFRSTNVSLVSTQVLVRIKDDDAPPVLTISPSSTNLFEGDAPKNISFTISLAPPSEQVVTVRATTRDGTAQAGSDYRGVSQMLLFNPRETNKTVSIEIIGDALPEDPSGEIFYLGLSNATNAIAPSAPVEVLILNDDTLPVISISASPSRSEAVGTSFFTVTLSPPSNFPVTVEFQTQPETALASRDFRPTQGTITFGSGETTKNIPVEIIEDSLDEGDETFLVLLSNPQNAKIDQTAPARATIIDNDDLPLILATGFTVFEPKPIDFRPSFGVRTNAFEVRLSKESGREVRVNFDIVGVSGISGVDYVADSTQSETLTFRPGELAHAVPITLLADAVFEGDETVFILLSEPRNAQIAAPGLTAFAVIKDSTSPPSLSIGDAHAIEGNTGTVTMSFPITLSAPSGLETRVIATTEDGSAAAGEDFIAATQEILVPANQTNAAFVITVRGDIIPEGLESFGVRLVAPVNAVISGNGEAVGRIQDDDAGVEIRVGSAEFFEGNPGTNAIALTVSLSSASAYPVSVTVSTRDDSAVAGKDYVPYSGVVSFATGEREKQFQLQLIGDLTFEPRKEFLIELSNPRGGTIVGGLGVVAILNDDSRPSLSITDAAVSERNSTNVLLHVTLNKPALESVFVSYTTSNLTAIDGSDYEGVRKLLVFEPGETNKVISVRILDDTNSEPAEEHFLINIESPTNATLADDQAVVTITDDDVPMLISISDAAGTEGFAGTNFLNFTVTLSTRMSQQVTVKYATRNGTALAGVDYLARSGLLIFPPGNVSQIISIATIDDLVDEDPEMFFVDLSAPSQGVLLDPEAAGLISDDDAPPGLVMGQATVVEGNTGGVMAIFPVTLTWPSAKPVKVDFATVPETAAVGSDFQAAAGTLTFAVGTITNSIAVQVQGDPVPEPTEWFAVRLTNATNALILVSSARGTIIDDDLAPSLSVTDATVLEGGFGTPNAVFTVRLSTPSAQTVRVSYRTFDGTAKAGQDFAQTEGVLAFVPGAVTNAIRVPLIADDLAEGAEVFELRLFDPSFATISDDVGVGLIIDDDGVAPFLTISDVEVVEGDVGAINAVFTLRLSAASDRVVTVEFETADQTAMAGADYRFASGIVTFEPGTVEKTVPVAVIGDLVREPDETFALNVRNAVNARLEDPQGIAIIQNNDAQTLDSLGLRPLGMGPQGFRLEIVGGNDQSYRVQYSPDLKNWNDLPIAAARTNGGIVTDAAALGQRARFYRALRQ